MNRLRLIIGLILMLLVTGSFAQENPDKINDPSIHTVLIHPFGNPAGLPIVGLDNSVPISISFDDFKASYQDYYYSIELVNTKWESVPVSPFEYTKGFTQNKIDNFSRSSIALQPYYHYQFQLPNQNCKPAIAGNYILKVFKSGDPSKIIFTKRFYVAATNVAAYATVQEPFDGAISRTHQKIQLAVDVKNIPNFQTDQIKVYVFQNNRWDDGVWLKEPSFIRGSTIEYNGERDLIFPAGKEYRWLDIQSLRLKSDRVNNFQTSDKGTIVNLKPDLPRSSIAYYSFNDLNGSFVISNSEDLQSETQNDYAEVKFTYIPKEGIPYMGENLYLSGALTNNRLDKNALMQFNAQKGVYEKSLLLKQGYYSYQYILRDQQDPQSGQDYMETEGDHWETENNYTAFVYYTPPGLLYPILIGFSTINSKKQW